tara:strand:+ start:34 stop:225 length:192 start_codon:yes stop_codon:yes gene_type:complete
MTIQEQIKLAQSLIDPEQKEEPTVELPDGYIWRKTIFGRWAVIAEDVLGRPHLDPGCERYWSM